MSNNNSVQASGGISTLGLLGVVFVVLRLTHVIDWSWIWVTCPFWAGLVLFLFLLPIFFLIVLAKELRK